MEPRPSRPSRPSQPYISTGAAPGAPAGTPAYGPGSGPGGFGGPGPFDASSAPPAAPPLIRYDPSYSPGQPLTPLDGGRGSRYLAPLLAVAALAVIVAAVAWAIGRARGGDDPDETPVVAQSSVVVEETATGGAAGDDGDEPTQVPDDEGAETAAPTEAPAAEGGAEPTLTNGDKEATRRAEDAAEADTPTPRPSRERDDARSWLPLTEEVGEGYQRTQNQVRDLAEVSGSFADPADAEAQLAGWGWLENAYREFELPDADTTATNVYNISVHRFESAQGAKEALPYFQDGARTDLVSEGRDLPGLGDQIRALEGTTGEGGQIFIVYVREGDVVIRIAGTSLEGNPREDVLALAERILAE